MIITSSQTEMRGTRSYEARSIQLQLAGWAQNSLQRSEGESVAGGLGSFRYFLNTKSAAKAGKTNEVDPLKQYEELRRQMLLQFLNRLHRIFFGTDYGETGGGSGGGILRYSRYSSFEEYEETNFTTTGRVCTADGREIDFDLNLSMSRSFAQTIEESAEYVADPLALLCDPLVINLDGNMAEVSEQKIRFDLDADGIVDEISRLGSGSGFLALDKNGDGKVNDGSELFGTKSGNGFADLAVYDKDGNGWIDEADEVFEKLKIWVTEADGTEKLLNLNEAGVGAICLNHVDTRFDLTDRGNHTKARIQKSGVFLYENGMAGSVQHLDLVKQGVALRA
ncbi:MAG: hypothetical protein IK115_13525 [Lachnospiraceae bacterium]|nr:hypothetical protein [Lachnospiraceae bacterium]